MAGPETAARRWRRRVLVGLVLAVLGCGVVVTDALGVRSATLPRTLALPDWLDPTGPNPDRAAPPPVVAEPPPQSPSERRQAAVRARRARGQ